MAFTYFKLLIYMLHHFSNETCKRACSFVCTSIVKHRCAHYINIHNHCYRMNQKPVSKMNKLILFLLIAGCFSGMLSSDAESSAKRMSIVICMFEIHVISILRLHSNITCAWIKSRLLIPIVSNFFRVKIFFFFVCFCCGFLCVNVKVYMFVIVSRKIKDKHKRKSIFFNVVLTCLRWLSSNCFKDRDIVIIEWNYYKNKQDKSFNAQYDYDYVSLHSSIVGNVRHTRKWQNVNSKPTADECRVTKWIDRGYPTMR